MKLILRSAFATALLASATAMVPGVANAGVSIGIGVPAVVVSPYGPGYSPYDTQYYYEPIYVSGYWYHGPYRWRMRHGERVFFVDGRWVRNEWSGGPMPGSIEFRNGGFYRGGRYDGFGDAERINARFRPAHDMREDRRELNNERGDMHQDRRDMREDRRDLHQDRNDGDRHDGDRHDGDGDGDKN